MTQVLRNVCIYYATLTAEDNARSNRKIDIRQTLSFFIYQSASAHACLCVCVFQCIQMRFICFFLSFDTPQ